jgi:hypothetical protein
VRSGALGWSVKIVMQHAHASERAAELVIAILLPSPGTAIAVSHLGLVEANTSTIEDRVIDQPRDDISHGMRSFHDCNAILWVAGISGDTQDGRFKPCP